MSEQLIRQRTMVDNSLQALELQPVVSPIARKRLQQIWQQLDRQVQALEAELLTMLEQRYA